ncbi:LptA/OstA family protein [Anaeromyxobacter sp. SG26]|uniref:LptA/OstA family protein n=1 Tax=Anaeromyxobacter sp. SG26 TaxID=2925407 RepID=UPI001F58E26A|nr:LptA/OstA family protein [Anaeromyxobacter sp. SG26]
MTLAALLALAALAGAPQAPARAKPQRAGASATPRGAAAGEGKVRIDADELHYAFQKREVIFTGKPVVLTRGDAKLTCARLVATNDARGEVSQAICSGDVRFERGERLVTCEKATYEAAAARLVCEGSPVLRDGPSEARGTRLVYDLKRDEAKLEGAKMLLPGDEVDARRRELEARRKGATP